MEDVLVSYGDLVTPFHFLVVYNSLFDAIVGSPTFESLQLNIDY